MKVTKPEVGLILNAGRRTALLPATTDQPRGRQRFHRYQGPVAGYVKITGAQLVGPLDEWVTDEYARAAGHPTIEEYRDEWCRAHRALWTNGEAWEVTFSLEPHREGHSPMRGPWDPGSDTMRRAPEPEKVKPQQLREFADKARRDWELEQQQREAIYRAMPLDQKLRLVQQDERLRVAGRDDLRVIEKRLEAIWNRGKAA